MGWLIPLPSVGANAKLTSLHIENTKKPLETNGERTLRVVSGLQDPRMKKYSVTLNHHDEKCTFVAYYHDGDNLPSASIMLEPPSPLKKGFPRINEPMPVQAGTSSTYLLTKKVPELSSSAMERIKSVVEALSVELGVDMQILLLTITEVFGGGGLENMEHGGPLADRPLRTRCVSSDSA